MVLGAAARPCRCQRPSPSRLRAALLAALVAAMLLGMLSQLLLQPQQGDLQPRRRVLEVTATATSATATPYGARWQAVLGAAALPAGSSGSSAVGPASSTSVGSFNHVRVVSMAVAGDSFDRFLQAVSALQQAIGSDEYTLVVIIDRPLQPTSLRASGSSAAHTQHLGSLQHILGHARHLKWLAEQGIGFRQVLIDVSSTHIGRAANAKRAAAAAFALSDFVIILDSSVVLAPDALRWFEWHLTSGVMQQHPQLATASCWSPSFPADSSGSAAGAAAAAAASESIADQLVVHRLGLLDKFLLDSWAQPWGLAMWRHTWDQLGAAWNGQEQHLAELVQEQGWVQSMPLVPRCNIRPSANSSRSHAATAGEAQQYVNERSLTSANFPASSLDRCTYTLMPRPNTSSRLSEFELYATFVRYGIQPDHRLASLTLPELSAHLTEFVRRYPLPGQQRSSC